MTYTPRTLVIGSGQATAGQIDAALQARGQALASQYAPDGQYQAPPALGQIIIDACRLWRSPNDGTPVNHDIVAAQVNLETAGWQSAIARDKNNPAGLGAEDDSPYDKAIHFTTPARGIRAQVAHLLSYVIGDGPWTQYDPRYQAVKDAGWLGTVTQLKDLGGKWATSQDYGQSVAALANELIAQSGGGPVPGTIPKPPVDTSYTAVNFFTAPPQVEAVVWHITQGTDSRGWLAGAASGVSANYLISRDGTIYELVDPHLHAAWANGPINKPDLSNPVVAGWVNQGVNPNRRTVSIEHEGMSSNGHGGSLTQAQIDAHIWLTAWLCQEFGLPADRTHIIGHYQINSVDKANCPGFSTAEWDAWVAAVAAYGQTQPQPADGADPVTGKYIATEFQAFYDAHGGIDIFGHPVSGAFNEDGRLVQYFERMEMQHFPENAGTPYEVQLRLLGTEELQRRYPSGAPA